MTSNFDFWKTANKTYISQRKKLEAEPFCTAKTLQGKINNIIDRRWCYRHSKTRAGDEIKKMKQSSTNRLKLYCEMKIISLKSESFRILIF